MSRFLLLGASRGLGHAICHSLLQRGAHITALIRNAEQAQRLRQAGVDVVEGDALDPQAMRAVCEQAGAKARVISTLGSFRAAQPVDFEGHRLLIDTMEATGLRRLLLVTSLGCGNSWQYLPARARHAFGFEVRLKTLAESWLQTSALEWTILRPAGLQDGEATGSARLAPPEEELHGVVRRADVATLAIELVAQRDTIGQILACVDDTLTR
ncbi:MAG: SDR family oxidoreductase [Aeromonas sp.]